MRFMHVGRLVGVELSKNTIACTLARDETSVPLPSTNVVTLLSVTRTSIWDAHLHLGCLRRTSIGDMNFHVWRPWGYQLHVGQELQFPVGYSM